jgi:ketosteroid isomerase-like protein
MSSQNVEIVRRHLEAWRSGDAARALAYMSEDVEFDASTRPGGKIWHGRDGVSESLAEWLEIWDEYVLDTEEPIDAGEGVVLSLWHESGRAKHSGALIAEPGATVFTLRDGSITKVLVSLDRAGVLAGLGLDPGGG